MSKNQPGIQRPTLDPAVHPSVGAGFRNVYDNLDHLRSSVNDLNAKSVADASKSGAAASASPTSGTYTPTLANTTNVSASTPYQCQYMQVGNVVTVSGRVDIDPTAAGLVQMSMTIPVKSNFGTLQQCAGTAACASVSGVAVVIQADVGGNRALFQWIAVDLTNQPLFFTFTYLVN